MAEHVPSFSDNSRILKYHPKVHYIYEPKGFCPTNIWRSVENQMRYSARYVQTLLDIEAEKAWEADSEARVGAILQFEIDLGGVRWLLYLNGKEVLQGNKAFAEKCFEQDAFVFASELQEAVKNSSNNGVTMMTQNETLLARALLEILSKDVDVVLPVDHAEAIEKIKESTGL